QENAGKLVFQEDIEIGDGDRDIALRVMARAGRQLFQKLFFRPAAGPDSKAAGEYLQKMASDPRTRLHVQIVANTVPVPWGLLYLGEVAGGAKLDWDNFLGMRHVIEVIPLQTELSVVENVIPSDRP